MDPATKSAFLAWRVELGIHQRNIEFPFLAAETTANDVTRPRQMREMRRQDATRLRNMHRGRDILLGQFPRPQPQSNAITAARAWRSFRHAVPQAIRPAGRRISTPNPPPTPPTTSVVSPPIDPEWLQNVSQAFGADGVNQVQRENLRMMFNPRPLGGPPVSNRNTPSHEEYSNLDRERQIIAMEAQIALMEARNEQRRATYPGQVPDNTPVPRA